MSEQRHHKRKALEAQFHCREQAGSGLLSFDTEDISVGGAFLKSQALYEQGEPLELEFALPELAAPVRIDARVAWVRRFPADGEDGGMGVQFLNLSDDHRRALEAFLLSVW